MVSSEQFEHIQRIRQDFYDGSERLKNSSHNSIRTLADDLYNKHTHFIFELIQNAEDNTYAQQNTYPPFISFRLTKNDPTNSPGSDGALIIQNNEVGFNIDNIDAICAVGETTKKKEQGYIGEKGIGFKSVFRVTDNPHIFSNGYRFCLPESDEETGLGYIVPQWIDTPPEGLLPSDTYIILPLTKSDFGYEKIEIMLRDIEPEVILFLSTLEEIRIETDTGDNLTILKDSAAMPEVAIIVAGNKQGSAFSNSDNFLVCNKRFNKPANIHHEKREGIEDREVSVAFPLNENSTVGGKIFAYLPIRSDTGFPFLINADFILPSSREDIQDVPWNYWLMRCVADLIACELLPLLKKRKILLNVQFLESLANRLNNLVYNTDDLFYAIYAKVREVLKNEALLPTHDNSFISGQDAVLTRSDAVRNLLNDVQLGMFLRPNVNGDVPLKWLSAAITLDRTPSLRKYIMESLKVEEVTPDMLARRLSEKFLSRQTDEWFIKFYGFLSDQPALWRSSASVLRTKPILRLQDGTHVNPSQESSLPTAYLSIGTNANPALPVVKWEISQNEDAYNFLKSLGVQESDIVAEVIGTVLPKYEQEFPTTSINEHLRDFAKIQRAYRTDSREKKVQLKEALQNTPFIHTENPDENEKVYRKPGDVYFGTEVLRLYFDGEPSCAFVNLDIYPSAAESLFKDLGVLDSVRIQREVIGSQGYVTIVSQYGKHKRGLDGFDPHIRIDGLEHAITNPTLEKSAFIWNHIVTPNIDCIRGTLEESRNQNYVDSTSEECISYYFGNLLLNTAWLPDSDGNMHKPSDIPLDDLPNLFKKDEQLAKKLNMPMSRTRIVDLVAPLTSIPPDVLNQIINAPPETIEQIESLLQSSPESVSIVSPIPQAVSFPANSVSNPDRRKKQILSELEDAPDQEYAEKVRSVRTTRGMIDPKTWLREQYTNDDDQMICQICHEEMPFKYRGENYYFDAVEILKDHFTKEYEAQFLALCPECSPKYRTFIKQVPEAMDSLRQRLIDADESSDFEIPLKLGDWNTSLRFVERHWLDMKTVLGFYARQPKQPEPAVEKAAVIPPKTTELKRVISPQLVEKKEMWDADQMLQQHFAQPVRFVTYEGIKDLSHVETSAFDLTGVDSKGREITLMKFEVLFAFPKEKMLAVKPHIRKSTQLIDRNLQPVERHKNRFQVANKLLRQVKENKSNVKIITRGGYVLSGWIQHFDKHVLYMRVAEKVVVVYRHGLFDFKVEDQ
ncbi:hypothetical protein C6503_00820 [Candidatus Poribacteria bacterium]|nr:MAG: hypothetical protein C6503_00820 [Candidatus Poribacteria bacterium]